METSTESNAQTTESNANSENQQTETVKNPEGVLSKNRELLGINKKLSTELSDLRDQLERHQEDKQISEGKKDDVISKLREEVRKLKNDLTETVDTYNWNTVESQIKTFATKEGCSDADKLIKLIDNSELSSLEVDSKFRVNQDDLASFVGKLKKDNAFLFPETSANINDINPSNKFKRDEQAKPIDQMTSDEIEKALMQLDKLERS